MPIKFMFQGQQGSIDKHGFISWGGMGFSFGSAGKEMQDAILKLPGISSLVAPANITKNSLIKKDSSNNKGVGDNFKKNLEEAFQNGRTKAHREIVNKHPMLNGPTRTMSKSQVLQKTRDGGEVVEGDLQTVRNGSHIKLRLSSGKVIDVQIEGN